MLTVVSNWRPVLPTLAFVVAFAAWCAAAAWAAGPDGRRPNVVIIYADDLGYGDVHCYNPDRCKIPTPQIDSLAQDGMRFTDAHASSGVCTPSRYALLTGRYHWRTKLQAGIVGIWGDPLIAKDRLTLGLLAKQHGYRKACIGKWHLGWDWPIERGDLKFLRGLDPAKNAPLPDPATQITPAHREAWQRIFSRPIGGGPTARGFDVYFGTDVPDWPPYCFIDNDRTVGSVLDALDAAGVADDTLVIFTSDNGCAGYVGAADLEKKGHFTSGPLRGYKASVFEGGHRVPFIVRWPGHVKPGGICNQLVHQADLMATLADILGAEMPVTAAEDSFSLLPLFEGHDAPVREHAVSCSSAGQTIMARTWARV